MENNTIINKQQYQNKLTYSQLYTYFCPTLYCVYDTNKDLRLEVGGYFSEESEKSQAVLDEGLENTLRKNIKNKIKRNHQKV